MIFRKSWIILWREREESYPSAVLEKTDDPEQNTETEENYDVQKGNRMVFSEFAYPKTPLVQDLVLFFIASIGTKVEKGEIEKGSR